MAKPRKRMKSKHTFWFRQKNPVTGKITIKKEAATVYIPPDIVDIILTEDHVLRSKKLHGRGNTQTCSGAICVLEHSPIISHPVTGTVDWQLSKVFIESAPGECYGYEHDEGWFAKMNDRKGGHDELIKYLRANGPQLIRMRPIKPQKWRSRPGPRPKQVAAKKRRGLHRRMADADRDFGQATG